MVTVVLVVLAMLAQPLSETIIRRKKEVTLKHQLTKIRTALDSFKEDWDRDGEEFYGVLCLENKLSCSEMSSENGYPRQLEFLIKGAVPGETGIQSKPYLRLIPIDPMTGDSDWGLRCYVDPPDVDRWCGEDVFDIYSKSNAVAMNQTEYRTW